MIFAIPMLTCCFSSCVTQAYIMLQTQGNTSFQEREEFAYTLNDPHQASLLNERQTAKLEQVAKITPITQNGAFAPGNLQTIMPIETGSPSVGSMNSNATIVGPKYDTVQQSEFLTPSEDRC